MRQFPPALFSTCAELLSGRQPKLQSQIEPAICFLQDLGYLDHNRMPTDDDYLNHSIRFVTMAEKLDLFAIEVRDAPRMLFVGGRVLPERFSGLEGHLASNMSGISIRLVRAFEACVGEGIEYLSQLVHDDEAIEEIGSKVANDRNQNIRPSMWKYYPEQSERSGDPSRWIEGVSLIGNSPHWVPTDLCFRRRGVIPFNGMSTGCAAGKTMDSATVSAILELVERDATALWWEGGIPPRPFSLEALADAGIESLFEQAGRDSGMRCTIVLDITTEIDIPCVAAISTDLNNGNQFACGLASRVNRGDAIRKAVHEMMQMELSHHVLKVKRSSRGDVALNASDRKQLELSRQMSDIWNTPLVQTCGRPVDYSSSVKSSSNDLQALLDKLSAAEYREVVSLDLTRDYIGIPVVKVFIPGLQIYPSNIVSPRLSSAIASTGGNRQYTAGLSLL